MDHNLASNFSRSNKEIDKLTFIKERVVMVCIGLKWLSTSSICAVLNKTIMI